MIIIKQNWGSNFGLGLSVLAFPIDMIIYTIFGNKYKNVYFD